MQVFFKKSFVRDFKKLPSKVQKQAKRICLEEFPKISNIGEFTEYPLSKMRGFKNYYRIRLG